MDYPLTIIEAPMGYGKTTALKEFLCGRESSVMWITFLNPEDTVTYFWEQLSREFCKVDELTGHIFKTLGFPADTPQIANILSLMHNLEIAQSTILVIDDFHLVKNPLISKLLILIAKENRRISIS